MRRRRTVMALVLLTGVALAAWKWTHQHEARFVGRWLVTEQVPATPEQIRAALDRAKLERKTEWRLESDGTGHMMARDLAGSLFSGVGSEFQWWSNGDGLRIKWGLSRFGWESFKEDAENLLLVITGKPPQNPVHEYEFMIEAPHRIRVEPSPLPRDPSPKVLYLTRLPEDEA